MGNSVILISAVCGDIGYSAVQAARDVANKIVGCDMRAGTPVLHLLDAFYEVPPASDIDSYVGCIKDVIMREGVDFFLPVSEPEIEAINTVRKDIETLGVKLLLNNSLIIENFLDKWKTVQFLAGIGVKTPRTAILKEYDGSFGFPLIVKPRSSYGSRSVWKIENLQDLEYARRKDNGSLLAQESIGSDSEEYTTGVFSNGKNVSSISFKRRLGADGTTLEASLVSEVFLSNLADSVARTTGLFGSLNIQSRRCEDEFIPFEVNPRISGTLLFRKKFGFDDLVWWINILSGKDYDYTPLYTSGKAVRYYTERYFDLKRRGKR
jgi:carbamoyl-phosphate synthase large subunit